MNKIINPTIKTLINSFVPPHYIVMWLKLYSVFEKNPIVPAMIDTQNRVGLSRYKMTVTMLHLMSHDLAEELPEVRRPFGAGRPAKAYRLLIPRNHQ